MKVSITVAVLLAVVLLGSAVSAQTPQEVKIEDIQRLKDLKVAEAQRPVSHMFQVVLLIGSSEASGDVGDVPENATQALDDIRGFLPYQSYKMLDVGIFRSDGHYSGMLNGPEGNDFRVSFRFSAQGGGDPKTLFVNAFDLTDVTPPSKQIRLSGAPEVTRDLLQASFSAEVGETVVVGTSKLNGTGNALLVLFTAID
jgi:hypothetical protein